MTDSVTFKGKPLKIKGTLLKLGDTAPDCLLTNGDLEDVKLSSITKGKRVLLMTLPSLDTSVCSSEAHRFNKDVGGLPGILTLAVSMDLPFAQKRWCAAEGVMNLIVLSDFKKREIGEKFGLLIPDLGLLARAIFILDANRKVLYVQLVKEVGQEPQYAEIFDKLHQFSETNS